MKSKAKSPSLSKKKTRRVGIYSGTFDPVHIGHLGFALQSIEVAGLDKVIFVPEDQPRFKANITALEHRLALLERAVAPYDRLSVARLGASQFSAVSVLPELQEALGDSELWLIMGSDVAMRLGRWQNLDLLLDSVSFVVGIRTGDNRSEIVHLMQSACASNKARYLLVDSLLPMENSTRIRRDGGVGAYDSLPSAVAEYIRSNSLYLPASNCGQ